jgi:hypothetical protein
VTEKRLFYVEVEEKRYLTVEVEAESHLEAEEIAEQYVVNSVPLSAMSVSDRSVSAYRANDFPDMADDAVKMNLDASPACVLSANFQQAIRDYMADLGVSREEALGAANSVLEEIQKESFSTPVAKMGM